jgi:predicted porin
MQKKLLAVAVGAALAAGAFVAQADTTVYGRMHVSIDLFDVDGADAPGNGTDGVGVSSNSSRLGVKGAHDLGNGLKGIWQIEAGVSADEGAASAPFGTTQSIAAPATTVTVNNFATRNTFGGFSGGFGTVLAGKHDTPYKLATGKLDPFSETVGDYNAIIGNAQGGNNFDLRLPNVVAYISPTFSGMHGAIAWSSYGPQQANGADNQDLTGWSVMGMYDQGPLFASVAYEVHQDAGGAGSGLDRDALKIGAGFTMGAIKVGGVWETQSYDAPAAAALEHDSFWLTGTYAMGNNSFSAAWGAADDGEGGVDNGGDMWALGWFNKMSKQTTVYVVWAQSSNDAAGLYRLGVSGHDDIVVPPAGGDSQALSVGTIIDF